VKRGSINLTVAAAPKPRDSLPSDAWLGNKETHARRQRRRPTSMMSRQLQKYAAPVQSDAYSLQIKGFRDDGERFPNALEPRSVSVESRSHTACRTPASAVGGTRHLG